MYIPGIIDLAARALMGLLFFISGVEKLFSYDATVAFMNAYGLPGFLLPAVIATEIFGAVALVAGWKTHLTAMLLAAFSLASAVVFHTHFSEPGQADHFLKNVAIAGGFLFLAFHRPGRFTLDRQRMAAR